MKFQPCKHWLLDMHFEEDWHRVEDKTVQENLNMLREAAINIVKLLKEPAGSKQMISKIMLGCLLDTDKVLRVAGQN